MNTSLSPTAPITIIGGGPAGLMAAEVLSQSGVRVDVYDAMPSLGRKFLMAGKGGMNISHAEDTDLFCSRYGARAEHITPMLRAFGPETLREWMHHLGIESFVGSSGRIFPTDMKAAPLLRSWLHRLRESGVRFHVRHRWQGIEQLPDGRYILHFASPEGDRRIDSDAVLLALGGGSWPKLGSDGSWVTLLQDAGVPVAPLRPTNCGFDVNWSEHLRERFAGQPVKSVTASFTDPTGKAHRRPGEFIVTRNGVEGGLIYAFSASMRDAIERSGSAHLSIDLLPNHDLPRVIEEVFRPRGSRSLSSHLQSRLGLKGVKIALLHECLTRDEIANPLTLASAIKSLPLRLISPRPLEEAISSAGGVLFEAVDENLMINTLPGVFCAGEMLDWEAPTGGYLLTGCLSSGHAAGLGALKWLQSNQ
ncbi:MAG: TIGR03862 family flavoprotein [Betaproteobacteria bacterium]